MPRPNILIIMSDEHDPAVTGCYGHPYVQTPHLDQLAAQSRVYENAYTNCPICMPARMSFLTGRYIHQINCWDNGSHLPNDIPTFAHYLEAAGYDTTLCGRMHINGPDRQRGFGRRLYDDMDRWINGGPPRRTPEARRGSNSHVTECGPDGDPAWLTYDQTATDLSVRFLQHRANDPSERPWLLVTGFMYPHFPLYCPREYFDHYYPNNVVLPPITGDPITEQHPIVQQMRYNFRNDQQLPKDLTRKALASYYGLTELTDHHIGQMLNVIDNSALKENTVVIYCSDHGEMAGMHGVWQKQLFYENACRVPLIIRTPDGQSERISQNVSLIDIAPTLLSLAETPIPSTMPGQNLLDDPSKDIAFSEYHAQGMLSAGFMIKKGDHKYCHYIDHPSQLFDTKKDPHEVNTLAGHSEYQTIQNDLHTELLNILNPKEIDQMAKKDQAKRKK